MHGPPGITPRILDTLRQLGLTEYGARCYVALLGLKSAEASVIAEAAEVPRTKVYATLKDLVDAGWVLAEGGRPVMYRAVAPEERIAAAEKRIAEDAATAARELQARFAMATEMVPVSLYMLRGREAVDKKTSEVISRAREELFLNLGFVLDGEVPALADAVERARRRGVVVRLVASPEVEGLARLAGAAGEARAALFPFRGIIADWRQALVAFPGSEGEPVALWNPTQGFMDMIAPLLRGAWERAPPLTPRR